MLNTEGQNSKISIREETIMSKIVGVIGLGLMGLAMSKKLIEAKFEVQGFDLSLIHISEPTRPY